MKPYIICHMMASLDGRIDCDMTEKLEGTDEYYQALAELQASTCLSGKTTMEMHYALPGIYLPADNTPIGKSGCHVATKADGYTVAVDSKGTLRYPSAIIDDKPLVCVVSRRTSLEYLHYLQSEGISWIAAGDEETDLAEAVEMLNTHFGVERMAIVGGGHINAAFLAARLLDEVSMMYAPGIDGRKGMTAAFDGLPADSEPVRLQLRSVKQYECGTVWMRYNTLQNPRYE